LGSERTCPFSSWVVLRPGPRSERHRGRPPGRRASRFGTDRIVGSLPAPHRDPIDTTGASPASAVMAASRSAMSRSRSRRSSVVKLSPGQLTSTPAARPTEPAGFVQGASRVQVRTQVPPAGSAHDSTEVHPASGSGDADGFRQLHPLPSPGPRKRYRKGARRAGSAPTGRGVWAELVERLHRPLRAP
jgi:hypothetical protein